MEDEHHYQFRRFVRNQCASTLFAVCLCAVLTAAETVRITQVQPPGQDPAPDDAAVQPAQPSDDQSPADTSPLAELEQLLQSEVEVPALQQEVTTVSGQQSTVGRSPAAVFVITPEMIRRSGATCIPEVLRMAPGIQVARVNSNQWAITSRGFNTNSAGFFASNNKLLVLIDGRTVYSPFFAGTYWDVQDVVLDDIERIEVIRGPGATIWGANAVNGVINVITKRAGDTQGGLAKAGGGTFERGFATGRVGGSLSNDAHYRVYGKWFERDSTVHPVLPPFDDWRQGRAGMRMDWTPTCCDLFTLQGDGYVGQNGFRNTIPVVDFNDDEQVQGGNVLARWTHTISDDNDWSLQLYYDRADRLNNIGFLDQQFNTYDIDFRRHFLLDRHNIVWGLGYRSVHDVLTPLTTPPATVIFFDPAQRTYDTYSAFVQDEVTLTDDLFITLGAKLQHNAFTHGEVQPTVRMLYSPEQSWAAWAAVSRAVRTPSRLEHDGRIAIGALPVIVFSRSFDSEELIAYELGYREQPEEWFSWDVAFFFNQYERLQSLRLTPPVPPGIPILNANDNRGEGYGAELTAQLDMLPNWRLTGAYSFLQLQIHPGPLSVQSGEDIEGSTPHNQLYLRSSHDLADDTELDFIGRYVDNLPFQQVPGYIELDVRLAWRPIPRTEFAVVGQNLLDAEHAEFGRNPRNEIPRGVYGMVTHVW